MVTAQMNNPLVLTLLHLWTGPLPKEELFPDRKIDPLLHWVIHPIKRWLAKIYLWILQRFFGLKVVAVTGSVGKTTTKDMLASILSLEGPTVVTRDNIPSTYTIPDTILRCTPATRVLVLEMGVEYPGDMDFYTWLARPDIGIITSVNRTHTHFLGTVENVSAEKGKLLTALSPAGFAVVNADDPNILINTQASILKFGVNPDSEIRIITSQLTPDFKTRLVLSINGQQITVNLPIAGRHFALNAAAAAAAAFRLTARPQSISAGLERFAPPPHRMTPVTLKNGVVLLDDSYNANPLAVSASLETLAELAQITHRQPVFIFGQMNELGQYEQSAHEEIGMKIAKLKIGKLFCTGPAAKHTVTAAGFGDYFETVEDLTSAVSQQLTATDLLLFKASRSYHFESIVSALKDTP